MIIKFENDTLATICTGCQLARDHPVQMEVVFTHPETNEEMVYVFGAWNPTFNEYNNYIHPPCPNCGALECTNLNIPIEEMEELELEETVMPYTDINQRYYIRKLIKRLREDFIYEPTITN